MSNSRDSILNFAGKEEIPKKIFLIGREKISGERKQRVDELLYKYPSLNGFYWAEEKIRELYRRV